MSETSILRRVAKEPHGSHSVSGSWQIVKRVNMSENAMIATLKLEGNTFSFSDPTGQGYTAKLDERRGLSRGTSATPWFR